MKTEQKTKTVAIADLSLTGDHRQRLKTEHVAELAKSIKANGLINPPLVRRVGGKWDVICGGDRVAAAKVTGATEIEVRICEASDIEAARLRITENLHRRRDDSADLLRQYLSLDAGPRPTGDATPGGGPESQGHDAQFPEDAQSIPRPSDTATKRGRGRPKTERGKRREEIAKIKGVTKNAIEQWDSADRKKEREQPPAAPAPPVPVIETHGFTLPSDVDTATRGICECIDAADKAMRIAQTAITKLRNSDLPFDGSRATRIYQHVHHTAGQVREQRPASICLYCKCREDLRPSCGGCGGRGYLVAAQMVSGVPRELKLTGDEAVVLDASGNFVPYAEDALAF